MLIAERRLCQRADKVESASYGDAAKQSTVIDWSDATPAGGEESAVVYGVTGLTAGDLLNR